MSIKIHSMRISATIIILLIFTAACPAQTRRARTSPNRIQATGFPNYCGDSLECIIAHSPDVVRATILSVDDDQITTHVRETIKGASAPGSTLIFSAGGWPFVVGQDVVLSLVDDKYGKKSGSQFLPSPSHLARRPASLLQDGSAAAHYTRRGHGRRARRGRTSHRSAAQTGFPLQRREDPGCPRRTAPGSARPAVGGRQNRLQAPAGPSGSEAFQIEHNIAIATALLADTRSQETGCWGKWQVGDYDVRESAVKLLQHWKVPAPTLPMGGPILSIAPSAPRTLHGSSRRPFSWCF